MPIMGSDAMDGTAAGMSSIPILPENTLTVESWWPGGMDGCADGVQHIKTAPSTIVAIVERGAYEVGRADGRRHRAEVGEAFLAQEGDWLDITHRGGGPQRTFAACWTHLRVSVFGSLDACRLLALPPVLGAEPSAAIRQHILATRSPQPGLGGAARRAQAALATLGILAAVAPPSAEGRQLLERASGLAPLAAWVRAHLGEPITLPDLARVAGTSRSRLHARFQRELALPPLAWVRELRLQAARDRLLATGEPVAAIGAACGFPDQFHFSRAVRARFGCAPLALRARGRLGEG
jgi:AraC-like DNA-binding protein